MSGSHRPQTVDGLLGRHQECAKLRQCSLGLLGRIFIEAASGPQARVAGRKVIMVFLDSAGKFSRLGDAERVRSWVESMGTHSARSGAVHIKG